MAKGDDIEARLIQFAVMIIRLCSELPKAQAATHISNQLLRSGTSPAANYAEARAAESKKDFVHKLKIVLKELNESRVWLKILEQSDISSTESLKEAFNENDELCRIINSSIKTSLRK